MERVFKFSNGKGFKIQQWKGFLKFSNGNDFKIQQWKGFLKFSNENDFKIQQWKGFFNSVHFILHACKKNTGLNIFFRKFLNR